MGTDNTLICMDCKEYISNVARNGVLRLVGDHGLVRLNAFLEKHSDTCFDHHLVFTGDDTWTRVPEGSTEFEYEAGSSPRLVRATQNTYVIRMMIRGKRAYITPEDGESWTWEDARAVWNELQALRDVAQVAVVRRITTEDGG